MGDGCLQSLAVLQEAPAVPKVNLTVQTLFQGSDTAEQGVLLAPAAMNAQGSSPPTSREPAHRFCFGACMYQLHGHGCWQAHHAQVMHSQLAMPVDLAAS